jgi:hypothetical protein
MISSPWLAEMNINLLWRAGGAQGMNPFDLFSGSLSFQWAPFNQLHHGLVSPNCAIEVTFLVFKLETNKDVADP